jgi:hypothetical protein
VVAPMRSWCDPSGYINSQYMRWVVTCMKTGAGRGKGLHILITVFCNSCGVTVH